MKIIKKGENFEQPSPVFVEMPTCRRTLFFEGKPYFVSLPKIRFVFKIMQGNDRKADPDDLSFVVCNISLCFINDLEEMVPPYLPNVFDDLSFCCPRATPSLNLEELISNQINLFFSSEFNVESISAFLEYYPDLLKNYNNGPANTEEEEDIALSQDLHLFFKVWSEKTKADPNWIPQNISDIVPDVPASKILPFTRQLLKVS